MKPSLAFRPEPFRNRMRRHARRLGLADAALTPQQRLGRYRDFIGRGEKLLDRYHLRGGSGRRVALCRSIVMDTVIESLFTLAEMRVKDQFGQGRATVAVLALGGYGRGELCPYSDIDIMFLYQSLGSDPRFREIQTLINDTVLYMLWDLGRKVGHSTRSVREAIDEATREVHSKNAMLEARPVCGSADLAAGFARSYRRFIGKDDIQAYIAQRLEDQRQRRAKYGGSVFMQEPDIKNGVGGLRDYQNILWMVQLKLGAVDVDEVLSTQLLSGREHDAFAESYDFLLRVRTELHRQSRRPTDVLNLEKQPRVAWNLGYHADETFARVEAFMRDYYRAAQTIFRISDYLEQRLALDARTRVTFSEVIDSRRQAQQQVIDGFRIRAGRLHAERNTVFAEDPVRLIRVFRHLQRFEVEPDFELLRLIQEEAARIDDALIASADAASAFRAILQEVGDVSRPLRLMNDSGVLRRYLPEWQGLHCLVQHEFYHRYTADEHTLNTIHELDVLFQSSSGDPARYRQALEETEHPSLLYLALLLHDIGKGVSIADHANTGVAVAAGILERLGIVTDLRDKILFLVRNHLEMARFWQRFDIDDPNTILGFTRLVENGERLRYLYVLTWCDARGTAAGLWTDYKDALHTQLFLAALAHFRDPKTLPARSVMIPREAILAKVPDFYGEEVEAHLNLMPERYFSYHNVDEIVLHLHMVHRLLETIADADSLGALAPVVDWHDDLNLGLTVVHIVTWDRAGLFYKLAGAFSLAGLNIVSAKALTRADHITIDTFYVTELDGGVVRNAGARDVFRQHLDAALLHNKDLMPDILRLAGDMREPAWRRRHTRLPAPLPPHIEVFHDIDLRRTIIEVQCSDEPGLLYRLTKAIYDHGFDISFARIATERHVAVDTFHIESVPGAAGEEADRLLELRGQLETIIRAVAPDAVVN